MSKPGLAFGLNLTKKPGGSKPAPPKRSALFGADEDSDDGGSSNGPVVEDIGDSLDAFGAITASSSDRRKEIPKPKSGRPMEPPKLKSKAQPSAMFGDLSSSLTSRKNAEAAAEVDPNVYEYDSVYDSLKPKKQITKEDEERKPKYMRNLLQAAEVRKRDALIAEEKKIAREREAEGDEFEGKEKFVTEAYKKQQVENRRLEEEEKRREEREAKRNEGGGMSAFYRKLLDKDGERHAEAVKASEDATKNGSKAESTEDEGAVDEDKRDASRAKELNEKGASIALNEDGQVVDKRQLLKGGLNVGAKKKEAVEKEASSRSTESSSRQASSSAPQFGKKQAMRERQSRMVATQLEESLKRSRDDEEAQRQVVERSAKSQKTEGEISSARERFLARKKAAEEAKKNGSAT